MPVLFRDRFLSPLTTVSTAVVVAASLLLPPVTYAIVAFSNIDASTRADTRVMAEVIEQLSQKSPVPNRLKSAELQDLLAHHLTTMPGTRQERLSIVDENGDITLTVGDAGAPPVIERRAPMFDGTRRIGEVSITRSIRPLILQIAGLSILGMLLAAASYVTLRVLPLRKALEINKELRQRDTSLAYANMLLKNAIEGSPDAIFVVDTNRRLVTYNQHLLDLWKISAAQLAELGNRPLLDIIADQLNDLETFRTRVEYLYAHPDETSTQRLDLKDGRMFDLYTQTLYGPAHEYLGRIWLLRDITDRERAADALRQSETLFKAIFDHARDGITLADRETQKFFLGNARISQMLGYSPEEFTTLGISDIHPADSLAAVFDKFERFARDSERVSYDVPVKRKDGSIFYADINSALVTLDGKTYVMGIFRDITERKKAEDAVRHSEERYRSLVESTSDYIWEVDAQGRYTYYSPHIATLLGYAPEDLIGKTPFDIMPPAEAARVSKIFASIVANRAPFAMVENTVLTADGKNVVMETSGVPIIETDGELKGYRGIERDITERKRTERAAQDRLQRAEAQIKVVGQVGQSDALLSGDVETLAREVTELASKTSGCERTNIWLFNDDQTVLHCIDLFEASTGRHSSGMILRESEFAHEIAVVKHEKFVDADDARTDPRTVGYRESYLEPLRITAMLDASIQASGKTFGLLCFEHVDRAHHWEQDEIAFACQLADKLGLAVISQKRREAETALQQRDALLHATTISATEFLVAASLDEAIAHSLQNVSQTIQIERMVVFERSPGGGPIPTLRYAWHTPSLDNVLRQKSFEDLNVQDSAEIAAWQEPLTEGRYVITQLDSAKGDVKRMLLGLGVKSQLIVPIMVDGKYWGQVGFDSCTKERVWADFEIEILRMVADLIGNAIQRDRYVTEIANANRIVQNTPTILYRIRGEPSLPMIYISQNIALLGYQAAALTAAPQFYKGLIHPNDLEKLEDVMDRAIDNHGARGAIELRLMTSRGEYRYFENRFTPIRDAAGRVTEIEGLLIDVTERKAAEDRIALLARTDPLTGLANRATFIERLRQAFLATRRGAKPFALLYLDLDRFKDINDTLGHPLGDRLLITTAERLKTVVRETDLVGRLGGDEFAILQTELDEPADAGALATKLCTAMAQPIHIEGNELRITVSIGISVYAADTAVPEDMLAHADVALYRAKEEGRDQYRFHTQELDIKVREEVTLAEELRTALGQGQFKVFYQPQVELTTGRIVGMEALIRWNHPTRGLLSPSKFLSVAERTGAITGIGHWVLDQACHQMQIWRDAGIAPQTIAVNVSAVQIKTGVEFVQLVADTLARWSLVPKDLELDVTESMLARAALTQNDVLERLQALGVKISIDDFGTKYSTLDYLKTYRVNRLKIPQALTDAATNDPESAAMVRAIVGIARELNIEVIAQGVENEAQWAFLTAASAPIHKVQGYYYSEPVPAARAAELLRHGTITPARAP